MHVIMFSVHVKISQKKPTGLRWCFCLWGDTQLYVNNGKFKDFPNSLLPINLNIDTSYFRN